MFDLLKRLLPSEPLPARVHFHLDDHGNRIFCEESICRPAQRTRMPLIPPHR